jgi:hypothetical protein
MALAKQKNYISGKLFRGRVTTTPEPPTPIEDVTITTEAPILVKAVPLLPLNLLPPPPVETV